MSDKTVYDTCEARIRALTEEYPKILEAFSFGGSYLGRTITALRLGEGNHQLLYLGGVCGSLFTTELLLRFAGDYADAVQTGRRIAGIDISYLFRTRTVTVVPLLNPDGAVLRAEGCDGRNPLLARLASLSGNGGDFSLWETNGRGVDLRCNYNAQFEVCMAGGAAVGTSGYPGMHPESEPECAAVGRFLRGISTLDLGIQFLEGRPGEKGVIAWNSSSNADYRTRTIAQILAGHSGYSEDDRLRPGSLKDWHRSRSAGPFFEISCYRECEDFSQAFLTLRYGQLQKLLFHSAVL